MLPCLEHGCHLWRRASQHSLATLDAIQKKAIELIEDLAISHLLRFPGLPQKIFRPFTKCMVSVLVRGQ